MEELPTDPQPMVPGDFTMPEPVEEPKGRKLTKEEEKKMADGFALDELTRMTGWAVIAEILQNMPKAHIDPRGMIEKEWQFAELNAFWQGQVAKELLDGIYQIIGDAHQLQKIQLGTIQENKRMRF